MTPEPLDNTKGRPAGIFAGTLVMPGRRGCISGNVGHESGMKFVQNAKAGLFFQRFQRLNSIVAASLTDKDPGLKQRLHKTTEPAGGV